MSISTGDKLPDAMLHRMGENGPEQVALADLLAGRKVVIFAVIGAYTGICDYEHVPSILRVLGPLRDRGVDEVICISVNDPFVLKAWDDSIGASQAGVMLLGDPLSEFTRAIGMDFDAPPVGFVSRSKRYAMVVDDGVVSLLQVDDDTHVFDASSGDALLAAMG